MLITKDQILELKSSLKTVCSVLKGSDALVVLDFTLGLLYGQDSDLDIALNAPYLQVKGAATDLRVRVEARKLHAILTHARGDVQLETANGLKISFGESKFELATTGTGNPPSKKFQNPVAIPAALVLPMVSKALTLAAGGRYGTVLLTDVGGGLRAVATDGLRLIVADAPMEKHLAIGSLLISQRAAEALGQLPGDVFHVFTDETSLVVDTGKARLVSRKSSAKFPDYERVLPMCIKREYIVKAEDMQASLDRLGSVIDDKLEHVTLALTNDCLALAVGSLANYQTSMAVDKIPLTGKSYEPNFDPDFDVMEDVLCFRHSFLVNFFALCQGEVHIKIEDTSRPVLFEAGPLKFIMASACQGSGEKQ
jgi:DNA polymerase III sliding clamp (beta) subunit (PCNA family)